MKIQPVKPLKLLLLVAFGSALVVLRSVAQDTYWTGTTGDFFDIANWSVLVPTNNYAFEINNDGTAIIDTNSSLYSGPVYFNFAQLGDTGTGTGILQINNGEVHAAEFLGGSYTAIGDNNNGSALIMNGGTLYYDGPQNDVAAAITGNTYLTNGNNYLWKIGVAGARAGINGLSLDVGQYNGGTSNCIIELHSNAVMDVANSLSFGGASGGTQNTFQTSGLIMDGNAQFNIGDGWGPGRDYAYWTGVLSGNSSWTVGNSMGVGNTNGCSNQGYFAFGSRDDHLPLLTVEDNASVNSILLKNQGFGDILLTNNAFFGIYDCLSPKSYNNPLAYTNTLYYPYSDSFWGYQNVDDNKGLGLLAAWGLPTFTVADHSKFVVNVFGVWDPASVGEFNGVAYTNLPSGFSIGNGGYTTDAHIGGGGANGDGGELIVKDYGTFLDYQSLHLGTSQSPTTSGILSVWGPNATINIGDELRLAMNLTNGMAAATGEVEEVISAPTQSTIHVANRAWLTNGVLKVVLNGYSPVGGETYNLIQAGTVDGLPKTVDYSAAPLSPGLVWNLTATSTNLVLQVVNTNALPALTIQRSGANLQVSWPGSNGILQSSTNLATGFTDIVPTATSPYVVSPTNAAMYFRLRQ
jgi:hypothetical protein